MLIAHAQSPSPSTPTGNTTPSKSILTPEEIAVIARAATTHWYASSPVPPELSRDFTDIITDFTFIPYRAKSDLAKLYGPGKDVIALLQADWQAAFQHGSLYLFKKESVSFPTHIQLSNGEAVELSIRKNEQPDNAMPWFLSYVPQVERLHLLRDQPASGQSPTNPASSAQHGAAPRETNQLGSAAGAVAEPAPNALDANASAGTSQAVSRTFAAEPGATASTAEAAAVAAATNANTPLPPALTDKLALMKSSEDYQTGQVPLDIMEELASYPGTFESFVWIPQRWSEKLEASAGHRLDIPQLLDRDWHVALNAGAIRYYEEKVLFPVSILRKDGFTPIEVAFKRDRMQARPDAKPWVVNYVDDFPRQRNFAGKSLSKWAHISNWHELLEHLADMALPEAWGFEGDTQPYSILSSYLTYTFYRLQTEGKVLERRELGIAAFNTGLVDRTYEPIYACFSPSTLEQPWRFEAFCKAGSRQWGKQLVNAFNPLPKRATYFSRKEDLLFDSDLPLRRDIDHILLDNISRLPKEFLAEEMRGSQDALDTLEEAYAATDPEERQNAFSELREIIEDDIRVKRRLINRLDDAIELAQKRVEWNFKTAVPAFYPTRNTMSLLLPLDLTNDDRPDVALVVELMDSGVYIGQTILTMQMAYNNARLICRPDSDWLNTSIRA